MKTLRILVVDDHEVVRLGIHAVLKAITCWEVCWKRQRAAKPSARRHGSGRIL